MTTDVTITHKGDRTVRLPPQRCILNDEQEDRQEQNSQALIPAEQDTITFHDKPLIVVRLPDGRNGVVLRWLCENLNLSSAGQIERIKRTEVIADDLVDVEGRR